MSNNYQSCDYSKSRACSSVKIYKEGIMLQKDLEQVVEGIFYSAVPSNCRNCEAEIAYEKYGNPYKRIAEAVYNFLLKEGHIKEE